jgi:crotonobetainyl-CoA:carnitine CoA-transferase CaiB-like acyl-CoA transferase
MALKSGPLAGVTVIDMSVAVTGPYAAWLLSGMGARVIKLEGPQGDQARLSARDPSAMTSPLFALYNGGKESITLNLKLEQGRVIFKELITKADVLIENLVPGTMDGWGLGYDDLSAVNQRLVYASVSGFGRGSRYAQAPGLDMAMQAMSGIMAATGYPESPPTLSGVLFVDTLVSPHMVSGIVAALYERERTGRGQHIEIAMRDVAISIPFNLYNIFYNTGRVPSRAGNVLVGYSPGNLYETSDGYVYIASNLDKQAHAAFDVIGRSDLGTTEGFRTRGERWKNREEIDRIVNEWTRLHTKRDVFEAMIAADVPCGIVQDVSEVLEDDDLNARGVFGEIDHPGLGHLKLPRSPIVFAGERAPVEASPALGQHNYSVYSELLGYDAARLAELVADGVITRLRPEPGEGPTDG